MKRKILSVACLSIMLLLSACQPTPEKAVVQQKDQRNMFEQAEAESGGDSRALAEMVAAPESYTFSKDGDKGVVFIRADATVTVPEAPAVNIYRVHPTDFSQEQVTALWDVLVGDTPMVEPPMEMTKSEIEAAIVDVKERLNDPDLPQEEKDWVPTYIEDLEKMLPDAPESIPEIPVDGTLREFEMKDYGYDGTEEDAVVVAHYMGINAQEKLPDADPMDEFRGKTFYVSNNSDLKEAIIHEEKDEDGNVIGGSGMTVSRRASIYFSDNTTGAAWRNYAQQAEADVLVTEGFELDEQAKQFITTTPEEARKVVEDFLAEVGVDDMAIAEIRLVNDENFGNYDSLVGPPEHYAYRVRCTRTLDGVRCSAIDGSTSIGEDGWGDSWDYEGMNIMLNDDGIFQMDWYAPITVEEQPVTENATLLPFEDIAAAFEQQIWLQYAEYEDYQDENYKSKNTFTIDTIVLEYQRIMEQDSIENGFMTPVWNFYGTSRTESEWTSDTGEVEKDDYTYRDVFLTINAVDGTMIDRWKGY